MKAETPSDPDSPESSNVPAREPTRTGIRDFFIVIAVIGLLRIVVGFAEVPLPLLGYARLLSTAVFLGLPIVALYRGADWNWTRTEGALFLGVGVAAHVATYYLGMLHMPMLAFGLLDVMQTCALMMWCMGLGVLVVSLINDKNLLIPVVIFLALFDAFLVLSVIGITNRVLANPTGQKVLQHVALQMPTVQAKSQGGHAAPMAFVGPADILFMGVFFIALYRFQLRRKATVLVLIPVMVAYMLVVLIFGGYSIWRIPLYQLPALLPIGAVVLAVNWREFKLNKEEKVSTAAVAALMIGLVAWGISRRPPLPTRQPDPSKSAGGQANQAPAGSPVPDTRRQSRSPGPSGAGSTPNPR
jgi:hypothetical protein